jgi:hypothetical protein
MSFDVLEDTKKLIDFIKGKNKDDNALIKLVISKTNKERLQMKDEYNSTQNSDLIEDLKSAYSGHFKDVLMGLFYSPLDYDCYQIRKAVKGLGTDEEALIEILTTRTSEKIEQMKLRYKEMFPGRDMVEDIKSDTSGSFWTVLKALLENKRNSTTNPDLEDCQNCAQKLYDSGINKKNTLETFTEILTQKSKEEIITIGKIYHKMSQSNILADIKNLFSGDTKKLLTGIVFGLLSPSEYFAELVRDAVKGLGTKDTTLLRIMVTRDEIDMPQIKQFYRQKYDKDMVDDIKDDTSGSYRKILVALATH